jgi:hypothetical protein
LARKILEAELSIAASITPRKHGGDQGPQLFGFLVARLRRRFEGDRAEVGIGTCPANFVVIVVTKEFHVTF